MYLGFYDIVVLKMNRKEESGTSAGKELPTPGGAENKDTSGKSYFDILSLRTLSPMALVSVVIYPFLFPSWSSALFPLACGILALLYSFYSQDREQDFYKRVAVSFIFSVCVLLMLLTVSAHLSGDSNENSLRYGVSVFLALLAAVIVIDLFVTYKGIDVKWIFRLVPAIIYVSMATLFLSGGHLPIYVTFSGILISGVLLAIYSWLDIERKKMNWFYLYCSFLSVAVIPVAVIVIHSILDQPALVSFSCHASSVAKRKRTRPFARSMSCHRRKRQLLSLREKGEISPRFHRKMVGIMDGKHP